MLTAIFAILFYLAAAILLVWAGVAHPALCEDARASEDSHDAGADHARRRRPADGARSRAVRKPVQVQQMDLGLRLGCSTSRLRSCCSATCVTSCSPCREIVAIMQPIGVLAGLFAMVAGLLLLLGAAASSSSASATSPGLSDHLMLALLVMIGHQRAQHEVRRTYRHRRGEGVLPRA